MAYSNTHADFYQTAMGTMVTEPESFWDTSTHCADCGVQYIYCGCPNEDQELSTGPPEPTQLSCVITNDLCVSLNLGSYVSVL